MVGIVLGVSMAPTTVRMVLVEGECANGVTVDEDNFDVECDAGMLGPSTSPSRFSVAITSENGAFRAASSWYCVQVKRCPWPFLAYQVKP